MNSFVTALTLKALDGLHLRAMVTAENIANASTSGYRPRQVTFERALAAAAAQGSDAVANAEPSIGAATVQGDDGLRLDLELATASSTALRYSALVETLNRELEFQSLAIRGGR